MGAAPSVTDAADAALGEEWRQWLGRQVFSDAGAAHLVFGQGAPPDVQLALCSRYVDMAKAPDDWKATAREVLKAAPPEVWALMTVLQIDALQNGYRLAHAHAAQGRDWLSELAAQAASAQG